MSGTENVSKKVFIFRFKTEGRVCMPLLDTYLEMGRFDRQWQLASKYDPFGKRLLGR